MSLNHKRRIFRPAGLPLRGAALPSRAMLLACLGGALTLGAGAWLTLRPSQAPALPPAVGHLAADPAQIAVLDGGTLRLHDRVVRLAGIDAPARGETCQAPDGGAFDCGVAAANALARLVRDAPVACDLRGHDAAGRPLATCATDGAELNQTLVAQGWARADRAQPALRLTEQQARAARRGIWRSAER